MKKFFLRILSGKITEKLTKAFFPKSRMNPVVSIIKNPASTTLYERSQRGIYNNSSTQSDFSGGDFFKEDNYILL